MNYRDDFEPDKFYHVFNHAVGSEDLFKNDENKRYFLEKYAKYIEPICATYCYCLMNNHFHFMVKVRSEAELLQFFAAKKRREVVPSLHDIVMQEFSNFFNAYAKAFNKIYDRKGALFIDYVRRTELDSFDYQKEIIQYIHFNPIKHGFVDKAQEWRFTSFHAFVTDKPTRLERDMVLNYYFKGKDDFLEVHRFDKENWDNLDVDWEFGFY